MAYTTIDNPELYFQTKLYSGNSSDGNAITLDGDENMQPDFVWIATRNNSMSQRVYDSVRGVNAALLSDTNAAEDQYAAYGQFESFDSDGFTVGVGTNSDGTQGHATNTSGHTYVAWCWKESATSGFDIVSYSGTGSDTNQSHSLSSAPKLIITKSRGSTTDWKVHTSAIDGSWDVGNLNTTAAFGNSSYTAATSSIFYVGSGAPTNASSTNYISYLFHSVQGYSRIGSYTGNGNADGTFIYLGFRPAWIMFKRTDSSVDWTIYDNKRLGYNENNYKLRPNLSNAEYSTSGYFEADILSNGFKIRTSDAEVNTSGGTYMYLAFAEAPFVNSNGVPCNAR